MLLVETYIHKSSIHGLGLFTSQLILKGTKVWEFTPNLDKEYTHEQFLDLPKRAQEYIFHYGWIDPEINMYRLSFDNDRFMNWNENPNLAGTVNELFALRDIQKDEELTYPFIEDKSSTKKWQTYNGSILQFQ